MNRPSRGLVTSYSIFSHSPSLHAFLSVSLYVAAIALVASPHNLTTTNIPTNPQHPTNPRNSLLGRLAVPHDGNNLRDARLVAAGDGFEEGFQQGLFVGAFPGGGDGVYGVGLGFGGLCLWVWLGWGY